MKTKPPVVLAKGKNLIAQKIKKLARGHGIPVIENKPVARALYKFGKPGQAVPNQMFRVVAEVLAYVYKNNRRFFQLKERQRKLRQLQTIMSELGQSKSPLNFLRNGDYALAIALFAVVIVLILPVPKVLLDLLLTISIAFSILVMLVIVYVREPCPALGISNGFVDCNFVPLSVERSVHALDITGGGCG